MSTRVANKTNGFFYRNFVFQGGNHYSRRIINGKRDAIVRCMRANELFFMQMFQVAFMHYFSYYDIVGQLPSTRPYALPKEIFFLIFSIMNDERTTNNILMILSR